MPTELPGILEGRCNILRKYGLKGTFNSNEPSEENVMRLGPDIARQIETKIDTMNRHWRDYDRIFAVPNP
jgi:hypothetical protein